MPESDLDFEQDYGYSLWDDFKSFISDKADELSDAYSQADEDARNYYEYQETQAPAVPRDEAISYLAGLAVNPNFVPFNNALRRGMNRTANVIASKWKNGAPITAEEVTDKVLGVPDNSYLYSKEYNGLKKNQKYFDKHLDRFNEAHPKNVRVEDVWMLDDDDIEGLMKATTQSRNDVTRLHLEDMKHAADDAVKSFENAQVAKELRERPIPREYPVWDGVSETFDTSTTKYPSVDEALQNGTAQIVSMSPEDYLRATQLDVFYRPYETVLGLDRDNIAEYAARMVGGSKAPMPYLRYSLWGSGQEGRHRAAAAKLLGDDKIPVVIWHGDF